MSSDFVIIDPWTSLDILEEGRRGDPLAAARAGL